MAPAAVPAKKGARAETNSEEAKAGAQLPLWHRLAVSTGPVLRIMAPGLVPLIIWSIIAFVCFRFNVAEKSFSGFDKLRAMMAAPALAMGGVVVAAAAASEFVALKQRCAVETNPEKAKAGTQLPLWHRLAVSTGPVLRILAPGVVPLIIWSIIAFVCFRFNVAEKSFSGFDKFRAMMAAPALAMGGVVVAAAAAAEFVASRQHCSVKTNPEEAKAGTQLPLWHRLAISTGPVLRILAPGLVPLIIWSIIAFVCFRFNVAEKSFSGRDKFRAMMAAPALAMGGVVVVVASAAEFVASKKRCAVETNPEEAKAGAHLPLLHHLAVSTGPVLRILAPGLVPLIIWSIIAFVCFRFNEAEKSFSGLDKLRAMMAALALAMGGVVVAAAAAAEFVASKQRCAVETNPEKAKAGAHLPLLHRLAVSTGPVLRILAPGVVPLIIWSIIAFVCFRFSVAEKSFSGFDKFRGMLAAPALAMGGVVVTAAAAAEFVALKQRCAVETNPEKAQAGTQLPLWQRLGVSTGPVLKILAPIVVPLIIWSIVAFYCFRFNVAEKSFSGFDKFRAMMAAPALAMAGLVVVVAAAASEFVAQKRPCTVETNPEEAQWPLWNRLVVFSGKVLRILSRS